MEFRSKVDNARWRKVWDIAFGVSSLVLALLFGVAFGNVLRGVPLTADGTYAGSFFSLLNPYALLVGLLGVALFFMHGAIYLTCKTSGPVRARLSALASNSWRVVSVTIIAVTAATLMLAPSLTQSLGVSPLPWIAGALLVAACVVIPMCLEAARFRTAFVASSAVICCLMALAAIGLFPRLLPCLNDPSASLTIYNSSSSATTLGVMLIIALIGMPLVIGYTFLIHRVFRGSESIAPDSY